MFFAYKEIASPSLIRLISFKKKIISKIGQLCAKNSMVNRFKDFCKMQETIVNSVINVQQLYYSFLSNVKVCQTGSFLQKKHGGT